MDTSKAPENLNNQLGAQLEALSAQIEAGIESGKYTLSEIKAMIRQKSAQTAHATQEYVRENPWKLVLVGGLFGLCAGVLTRSLISSK
jgi:ElaB/YqjD/DUF883 family membrane-anchored ribosome-binding protein